MKVQDLFEAKRGIAKFSVEHENGRHKRAHEMSINSIIDSIMFTPAQKKRISKLEIGGTVTTQSSGLSGRTLIRVTRTS